MSSLAKLPLIALATTCLHICYMRPNPPPSKESQETVIKEGSLTTVTLYLKTMRIVYWIFGALEVAAIISAQQKKELPATYITGTNTLGVLLIAAGAHIRHSAFITLGSMFTFEINILKEHKLVKHGVYSFVRHPSYTGLVLTMSGATLWFCGPGSILHGSTTWTSKIVAIALMSSYVALFATSMYRMGTEDELLRKQFGGEWVDWAQKVPYKLIPYVY